MVGNSCGLVDGYRPVLFFLVLAAPSLVAYLALVVLPPTLGFRWVGWPWGVLNGLDLTSFSATSDRGAGAETVAGLGKNHVALGYITSEGAP